MSEVPSDQAGDERERRRSPRGAARAAALPGGVWLLERPGHAALARARLRSLEDRGVPAVPLGDWSDDGGEPAIARLLDPQACRELARRQRPVRALPSRPAPGPHPSTPR